MAISTAIQTSGATIQFGTVSGSAFTAGNIRIKGSATVDGQLDINSSAALAVTASVLAVTASGAVGITSSKPIQAASSAVIGGSGGVLPATSGSLSAGGGLLVKDETSGKNWFLHVHADRIRLFDGVSTELVFTTPADSIAQATNALACSGNAATATLAAAATKLATARTIGGVSFDGTANINLPGVNTSGNQNTSGNAATATLAATATTATNALACSGNAATATLAATATTATNALACSGNAATATLAATATISYNNRSAANYQILFGSGVGLYASDLVTMNPSTGTITTTNISGAGRGGIISGFSKVYNAVWNDYADYISLEGPIPIIPGRVYSYNGHFHQIASSYAEMGVIGICSDTFSFVAGHKEDEFQVPIAVCGFVLAYVDKVYPSGTPLTSATDGGLTEMTLETKMKFPERLLATFYKEERSTAWYGIEVNGRHWVQVR